MFGSFGEIPWDFKSLRLRHIRALRGYAMDFKSGGCGSFRGIRGEERGRRGAVQRISYRYCNWYCRIHFPNILLFNMDSEERKMYPMTPDQTISAVAQRSRAWCFVQRLSKSFKPGALLMLWSSCIFNLYTIVNSNNILCLLMRIAARILSKTTSIADTTSWSCTQFAGASPFFLRSSTFLCMLLLSLSLHLHGTLLEMGCRFMGTRGLTTSS
jgi:hypothetical protein